MENLKSTLSRILSDQASSSTDKRLFNRTVIGLILFSLIVMALATEPTLQSSYGSLFQGLEVTISVLFGIEYIARVWTCTVATGRQATKDRIRYCLSFKAIIDLVAFLPTLLTIGVTDAFIVRILRLTRLARLARLGRYSPAMQVIGVAIKSHWRELVVSLALSMIFLFISAVLLYLVEGEAQPEAFGSIPRAMYWAVVTLTTLGYGDVFAVTALGKACTGLVALVGVGTVALPAGILAAAFSEAYKETRQQQRADADSNNSA